MRVEARSIQRQGATEPPPPPPPPPPPSTSQATASRRIGPAPRRMPSAQRVKQNISVPASTPSIVSDSCTDLRATKRVTRQRETMRKKVNPYDCSPGKLVWACYELKWWPAITIRAEDAGMIATPGKVWVFWLAANTISELKEASVECFSSRLEARIKKLDLRTEGNEKDNELKELSCLKTVELLKSCFFAGEKTPPTKPYGSWLLARLLPILSERGTLSVDDVFIQPYPADILGKLETFKQKNAQNSEKHQRYLQEKKKRGKTTTAKARAGTDKKPEPLRTGGIEVIEQTPGLIAWGKLKGYQWLPCTLVDYHEIGQKEPVFAHQWVIWYDDFEVSQVHYTDLCSFLVGMKEHKDRISAPANESLRRAVVRAAQDYLRDTEYEVTSIEDVERVVCEHEGGNEAIHERYSIAAGRQYGPIVQSKLAELARKLCKSAQRTETIREFGKLQLIRTGEIPLSELCVSCFSQQQDNVKLMEHPFFEAYLCEACLDLFVPKMFAYDSEGKCIFCSLCGSDSDQIKLCCSLDCQRTFCAPCIECFIAAPDAFDQVMGNCSWRCVMCEPEQSATRRSAATNDPYFVIGARADWKKRLVESYNRHFDGGCGGDDDDETSRGAKFLKPNRKPRILSCFDGLGTGYLVMKNLGIDVDRYFASEIDEKAMRVAFRNHGGNVIQLGDILKLDRSALAEITPIHLLIGGSPCNELSIANPNRRGIDDPAGSGPLFYQFLRVLKTLQQLNGDTHLFWLFENVASMSPECRRIISKNLGREPIYIDAADFSAQHRPRLFWSNLPMIFAKPAKQIYLQDCLCPCPGVKREALVKKINTVTTNRASLKQTKYNLKVVKMGKEYDGLWLKEVERVFGFPWHYTDADLTPTDRMKLLGKAWDVHTLEAILRPLLYFPRQQVDDENDRPAAEDPMMMMMMMDQPPVVDEIFESLDLPSASGSPPSSPISLPALIPLPTPSSPLSELQPVRPAVQNVVSTLSKRCCVRLTRLPRGTNLTGSSVITEGERANDCNDDGGDDVDVDVTDRGGETLPPSNSASLSSSSSTSHEMDVAEVPKEDLVVCRNESSKTTISRRRSRPKGFPCPRCGKSFTRKSDVKRHVETIHDGVKPFQCETCGKTFGHRSNLSVHERSHGSMNRFKCKICAGTFTLAQSLKTHVAQVHGRCKMYKCDRCKSTFKRKSDLRRHIRLRCFLKGKK